MRSFGRVFGAALTLAVLALLLFGALNYRAIADWVKLRSYTPPQAIARLADKTDMTPYAKRVFYVNQPQLVNNVAAFREACPIYEETIVLGCYHSNQRGIYIYDVKDKRLNGIAEVTAAHEMLHGAYDRLSQKDKDAITSLLEDFYDNKLRDQRVLRTIDSYKKTEPDALLNEMHSIFATEVNSLTPALESYYQRYFISRSAVVSYADRYEDEFARRVAKIEDYTRQMDKLRKSIDSQKDSLTAREAAIEAERRRLDSLRSAGRIDEYNAAVPGFNSSIFSYNAAVAELRADITRFNRLVASHNALAAELRSLQESLDTSLAPQPTH